MKVLKQYSAKGKEGCLLIYPDFSTAKPTGKKNRFGQDIVECEGTVVVFRVYERDGEGNLTKDEKGHAIFKDYKIRHHDLDIKLLSGQMYETDEGNYIDYPDLRYYNEHQAGNSDPPRPENAQG
jgi:hypothetical protein